MDETAKATTTGVAQVFDRHALKAFEPGQSTGRTGRGRSPYRAAAR